MSVELILCPKHRRTPQLRMGINRYYYACPECEIDERLGAIDKAAEDWNRRAR